MPRHVVFATFGSLGDVHPFLALGRELRRRGHRVTIATSAYHRTKVEADGCGFRPVRPDIAEFGGPAALFRAFSDGPGGPVRVLRKLILPRLRETAEDLLAACADADFLGAHPIFYPAPLVAEKLGLPWAATLLQPMTVQSLQDPSLLPALPAFAQRLVVRVGAVATRPLVRPVAALRRELGLPPSAAHPMFGGQFSPRLNLALFSPRFAAPQADWPRATVATGFPFLEEGAAAGETLDAETRRFLDAGPAPLVFTLGSTAVDLSVRFYVESVAVARRLGQRAVLLAGHDTARELDRAADAAVRIVAYAPHGALFPHAAAVVHSGGIGTTAQALRAGRPQLVVPFGFDQPDNARRVARLGVGSVLPIARYSGARAADRLAALLGDRAVLDRAARLGREIAAEDGTGNAAAAIEAAMTGREQRENSG
jgi:UDP:flavonoid glycosyltransferase YjiC (YdhE family)